MEKYNNTLRILLNRYKYNNDYVFPQPWHTITLDFNPIIHAFQNLGHIGKLRQRWKEIQRLQLSQRNQTRKDAPVL